MQKVGNIHTILLGGIGGDAHSVGLNILRQALFSQGYRVLYLGTQNSLDDFFRLAGAADAVMISNMDGHAKSYLRNFPDKILQYKPKDVKWYLGGNLTIGDAYGYEKHFLDIGFDRAFVKFIDILTILEILKQDLYSIKPKSHSKTTWEGFKPTVASLLLPVSDEVMGPHAFDFDRKDVLAHWRTGTQAKSIHANAEYLAKQPSFPAIQEEVNIGKRKILIQPRSGVGLIDGQIKLFKAFKSSGVDVLSYQVDSFTRNNNYAEVEMALRESGTLGESYLNGFPVINHGVSGLRRIQSELGSPMQTRHSTRDPRLLAEISYAGGVTAFEGGAICYNIPYYKDYSLSESISKWQYVDRLTGIYFDKFGIKLDREFFGVLTGTLIPPSLAIVVCIIETILAVTQGVKCVSLGYAEQGNRSQDIAAIRTMRVYAEKILKNLGYSGIQVNVIYSQYMAAFPQVPEKAEDLIYNSAKTAALSGATRLLTKTPVEAYKIPTLVDNLQGILLNGRGILDAKNCDINEDVISHECQMIESEVDAIFDSVMKAGFGSLTQGVVNAFSKGYLDVPFSPSIHNRGEVSTARDASGAVRFLSFGQLQFNRGVKEFHEEKMSERRKKEGLLNKSKDYLLVEKDVMRIARGQYDRWPLES